MVEARKGPVSVCSAKGTSQFVHAMLVKLTRDNRQVLRCRDLQPSIAKARRRSHHHDWCLQAHRRCSAGGRSVGSCRPCSRAAEMGMWSRRLTTSCDRHVITDGPLAIMHAQRHTWTRNSNIHAHLDGARMLSLARGQDLGPICRIRRRPLSGEVMSRLYRGGGAEVSVYTW